MSLVGSILQSQKTIFRDRQMIHVPKGIFSSILLSSARGRGAGAFRKHYKIDRLRHLFIHVLQIKRIKFCCWVKIFPKNPQNKQTQKTNTKRNTKNPHKKNQTKRTTPKTKQKLKLLTFRRSMLNDIHNILLLNYLIKAVY